MSTKYAIVGGKLIDGTGAEPVENSLVLVDDNGKIEYAGAMQDLPEGVEAVSYTHLDVYKRQLAGLAPWYDF